jgi:hypothetical protein
MESQDRESKFELSLSQLPNPPVQLLQPPTRNEARPWKPSRRCSRLGDLVASW